MSKSQRRIDPAKELTRLEQRHKRLKAQVAEFESKLTLTAQEQLDLQQLKKKKLATKDAIHRMTQL
ncbi:MAG: YdcH family protein [Sandaracinaceae bacterium]|nr:YdcH family protein [Sandaracinaceae bacterium]